MNQKRFRNGWIIFVCVLTLSVLYVSCGKTDGKKNFQIQVGYKVDDRGELAGEREAAEVVMAHLSEQLRFNPQLIKFGEPNEETVRFKPVMFAGNIYFFDLIFYRKFPSKIEAINWAHDLTYALDQYISDNPKAISQVILTRTEFAVKD